MIDNAYTGVRTHRRHSAQDISPRARLSSMSSSLVVLRAGFRGSAGISHDNEKGTAERCSTREMVVEDKESAYMPDPASRESTQGIPGDTGGINS